MKCSLHSKITSCTVRFRLPIRTTWGVMGKEELDQTIFRPSGFWLREYNVIPALEYLDLPNCSHVRETARRRLEISVFR